MEWLWVAAGAILLVGLALLTWSARLRSASGLPRGQILASDTQEGRSEPLTSQRFGLTGTPDYILSTPDGPVPVEVKPTRNDPAPRESHLLQVLAYCLLLEEQHGKPPPYGLLRYSTETFRVDYNRETRAHLISVLEQMRRDVAEQEIHRSHDMPARCRACAYRTLCDEALH